MRPTGSYISRMGNTATRRMHVKSGLADILKEQASNPSKSAASSSAWAKLIKDGFRNTSSSSTSSSSTGSTALGSFNGSGMTSKTEDKYTPEQWEEKIKKVAETVAKNAAKTGKYEFSAAAEALQKEYMSTVSPDRVALINKAIGNGQMSKIILDGDGNYVAGYSQKSGWTQQNTVAEDKKVAEFKKIFGKFYDEAFTEATKDKKTDTAAASVFDAKA